MSNISTQFLTGEVIKWLTNARYMPVTEVSDPALRNRIDVFAMKTEYAGNGDIVCVEVKISETDLRRDFQTGKNQYFVDHSDYFYYAVPRELVGVLKNEYSRQAAQFGILAYYPKSNKMRCARKPLINAERQVDIGLFTRAMRRAHDSEAWSWDSQLSKLERKLYEDARAQAKREFERRLSEVTDDAEHWQKLRKRLGAVDCLWLLDNERAFERLLKVVTLIEKIDKREKKGLETIVSELCDSVNQTLDKELDRLNHMKQDLKHIKFPVDY